MTQTRGKYSVLFVVAFLAAAFGFQNCSQLASIQPPDVSDAKIIAASSGSGNGSTYDGMTYQTRLLKDTCADGSTVQAAIKVTSSSQSYLIRDNCQDITPVPLLTSILNLLPHNNQNLVYQNALFTAVGPGGTANELLLCRGNSRAIFTEGTFNVIFDLVLSRSSASSTGLYGQIKRGAYDESGTLRIEKQSGLFEMIQNPDSPLPTYTSVKSASSDEQATISIRNETSVPIEGEVIYKFGNSFFPGASSSPVGSVNDGSAQPYYVTCFRPGAVISASK